MDFVKSYAKKDPDCSIVLMSGNGSRELALEAMKHGAYDYIEKPFEVEELLFLLEKIREREKLLDENLSLRSQVKGENFFPGIVAQSKAMKDLFDTVLRLAQFHTTVLISGESGTGKELIARAIHDSSPRSKKAFVAVNCGAIPENLMESELFGHKKGAFTDASQDKKGLFEEADGGTLFLDEIGEMPGQLQVKLLRALQERQIRRVGEEKLRDIDVRVVAATLRDLDDDVEKGKFREDLFYRLNVVSLKIPPLRDRPEDIPVLVDHFIEKYAKKFGLEKKQFSAEANRLLLSYSWRGNVRELENCVERALVLSDGKDIPTKALPATLRAHMEEGAEEDPFESLFSEDNLSIKQLTKALEISLIRRALEKTDGNRTKAAKILEISHRALLYKLKEYEIS